MAKPIFNPVQFELRNELPSVVSAEQFAQISQVAERVNIQLNWVAQILGWSGDNYWTNLSTSVSQKRALLGGTFGVYNSYTLLRLKEVRSWEPALITDKKPNIAIGQRVIIGDQQTYIYDLIEGEDFLSLNIGEISSEILSLLELGAAIKVDCAENRPFPFYRPEPLASGDADFRCSTGTLTRTTQFYDYYDLIVSPFSQDGILLDYVQLNLYGGSYYYFDRAVYLSVDQNNFTPWVECQWVESKGLWQLYVPSEAIGNRIELVWAYASQTKRSIASKQVQIVSWTDPSDWGQAGAGFNPVTDVYNIEISYNIAGLNFSLGTYLHLGDLPPSNTNPLWFDAGANALYANINDQWVQTGVGTSYIALQNQSAPPPYTYDIKPGTIWQSPEGRVFIWDAGSNPTDFYYFFPNSIIDGFIIINPSFQSVEGLYVFNPDNFYIHNPNGVTAEGFIFFNCLLNDEGFYVNDADVRQPDWHEIGFFSTSLQTSVFTPAYASNLSVQVDGTTVPNIFQTDDYKLNWEIRGDFLYVSYRATTTQGETFVPNITVLSAFGANPQVIDISADFTGRVDLVTSVPYNERGPLNNFLGVWGNKGGARPMDFVFDALDIHGFDEQEALYLAPVDTLINFDELLGLVTGNKCYVGDQPPAIANVGDYYWNRETGAFAVLYLDRDRQEIWVEIDYPTSICQLGAPDCDYFPLKPILSNGSCFTDQGDLWQDPATPAVAVFYESPNGVNAWVETNWNIETGIGWEFSQSPDPVPDFSQLSIYVTDDFAPITFGQLYETENFSLLVEVEERECALRFEYKALSEAGIQTFPTIWVAPSNNTYPPAQITEWVFSTAKFYLAPAVQNAGITLRPWKTQSLEVADVRTLDNDTYANPLLSDQNLGPGDENWDRSFIRLPSEYGRNSVKWSKANLVVEDFTYGGTDGSLKDMRCPTETVKPQIYEEVVFYNRDPGVGTVLYSEPFLFSDVEGFYNLGEYFEDSPTTFGEFAPAALEFAIDDKFDEWIEANLNEYDPLHLRQALDNGDWDGIYLEPTGNRALTGFVQRDLRVKSIIPVAAPISDASIYKYPPLCPQGPESYAEDPNNCKVTYAYFAADLAAAEDGFFDQQKDVAWREPLVEDQTLYILN
jgi:hypothetical protein